jgi:hypothetical protein
MHGRFSTRFAAFLIQSCILAVYAAPGRAEPPSVNTGARVCGAQAAAYLDARLAIWQGRLNLANWKISLLVSHAGDLKPKTMGNIHWDSQKRTATIRVLDPADYQLACRDALADMEMTVVHELVHLELSSLPRSQASRHEEELAVNRIADALLRLDRQNGASATTASTPTAASSPAAGW